MLVMSGEQGEAHGGRENRDNISEDLRTWFCQLSTQERVQVIAVEDVVWIRLFNILYRKHKSWMRQQGTPPTWDRDQVRKLFEKVQRSERNRIGAPSTATSTVPSAVSSSAALVSAGVPALPQSVGLCLHGTSDSRPAVIEPRTQELSKSRMKASAEEGSKGALGGALSKDIGEVSESVPLDGNCHSRKPRGKESRACCDGDGEHYSQTALQIGERLQESVRLCILGGDSRDGVRDVRWALTLSEAELSRPRKLLHDLQLYSCRGDVDETSQEEEVQNGDGNLGGQIGGFLSLPPTETDALRGAVSPMEDPLMETAWLSQRFPKAAIGDMLANRLELSLWASYRRIGKPVLATSSLSAVPRVIDKLHAYWRTLSQRHRLRFLEGVPEAEAVIAGSSGEGTAEGGDDLVRDLVLAPIAWCFKDDGAKVRGVVERLQRACADRATVDGTGALEVPSAEQDARGSDDSGPIARTTGVDIDTRGGAGDDVATDSATAATGSSSCNTASEEGSVEHAASEPSLSSNFSKNNKKIKRKKKKGFDSASIASGSVDGSEGPLSPEKATRGPDKSITESVRDANLSASEDGAVGEDTLQQSEGKANGPSSGERVAGSASNVRRSQGSAGFAPDADAPAENVVGSNDGWVVSTNRRKAKEPKEESRELRRGGVGGKTSKTKDGGSHPKATTGHRESLRDSQREPYRDRGEIPVRGGKGPGRSEGRSDRDESSAPWSRGTLRQESGNKGDDGAWGKGGSSRERREEGSRREKRESMGPGVVPGWPRAGARDRDDNDAESPWAIKGKEEDTGPWTKRSGNNNTRENGYPPSSRTKDTQVDRSRSSSFADMVRGSQGSTGGEEASAVSPLVKSKSVKVPKTTSTEISTLAWGSGKPGGAPSFATVLLGGSSATQSTAKPAPPPALESVDSKVGASAVSPATTVSASPVTVPEAGSWGDTPTPLAAMAPKPATPKPMAWTTGNTTSVILFGGAAEPSKRSSAVDECQKEQVPAAESGDSQDGGKVATGSAKALDTELETDGNNSASNGHRSPTPSCGEEVRGFGDAEGGGVTDVMVEVLDKVGDVIVKRAHSRANKAKSYARAIAELEGRAQALATAYQRQDGLLHGSWESEPSTKPVVAIDAAAETGITLAPGPVDTATKSPSVDFSDTGAEHGVASTDGHEDVAPNDGPSPGGSTASIEEDDGCRVSDADTANSAVDSAASPAPVFVVDTPTAAEEPSDTVAPTAAEQSRSGPSAPDHAVERGSSGRHDTSEAVVTVSGNPMGQQEQRRGTPQADHGGGGSRAWSDRASTAGSWSRGNAPLNASRSSGRRGVLDAGGRSWQRSGQAMGGGGSGNMAGVPSNDFRGGRPRVQRAVSLMTPGQQQGKEAENGRVTIPIPRGPVPLRSTVSMPIAKDGGMDGGDASARGGYMTQPDVVAPSTRVVMRSPTGHRPRSSSAGSGSRRGGMGGAHYPHFQQADSWSNNEWGLGGSTGGGGGGAQRGIRSGGGGGGWQGRDGDVGRPQYPYRDDNFYRSSPVEVRQHGTGGGGGANRHSRLDQIGPHRRGHVDSLPRPLPPYEQQAHQHQPQMPLPQQQPQIPQAPPARFRSRSGGANELSIGDRRVERMEYEYNLMVSCLDRNVDSFMQKLRRAMRPRRRAWSQVISRVRELVAGIWKEAKVEMYGSCYTGLELPSSDVDVVVCGVNGLSFTYGGSRAGYSSMQTVANLQKLANVLQDQNWVRGMKVIETAAVPVIKILADPVTDGGNCQSLFEEEGGRDCWQGGGSGMDYIPLDISFESPQHGGLASSRWVRDCIQGGKYGFALPAVMVLKEVLCQRGLNQPWSGGLSSYSLINMMITVLQRAEVERARARRIVARSHAAAHIVRQGALPPPQAMPPLSPQMSIGPQTTTFGPPPPQAVTTTVAVHGHTASDYENVKQEIMDVKIDHAEGGEGGVTHSQGQPTGETAVEDGGGGLATGFCRAATVGRRKNQAYVAAAGESSGLNTEVSGDVHSNNPRVTKSANVEAGDGKKQRAYSALDDTADHEGSSPASARRASSWGESHSNLSAGAGMLPTGGERGIQAKCDGFTGAAVAGGSGTSVLPNGLSTGTPYGPGRAEAALPEEATQTPRAVNAVAGTAPPMYPAQASQAPMQGPMLPVQVPMPPPATAPPVTRHSIGINADLFHMKHMEITLSQDEVDRADLSGMTPGEVLVRFFEFFGRQFDSSRLGISVGRSALNNPFPLAPGVDPRTGMAVMDAHVVIEDPLDRDQNVARSCFGFPQVQWLFGQCLSLLQERGAEMAEYDRDADLLKMLLYY